MRESSPSLTDSWRAPMTRTSPSAISRSCSAASSTWLELLCLLGDCLRGELDRIASRDSLSARKSAEPERHAGCIARQDGDILRFHPKLFGADLRKRRAQALADRSCAGVHGDPPCRRNPHHTRLEGTATCPFEPVRKAHADVAALRARVCLP